MTESRQNESTSERRQFLQAGAAAAVGLAMARSVHAAGKEEIRVGLVGCGGRGNGAAQDAMNADPRVRIVAIGDVFKDKVENNRQYLQGNKQQYRVTPDRSFVGFDAIQKVLACELDYVILATPPHFRPAHLAAAIAAGKNVFMEKPVAVDPPGCRSVMESGKLATQKGLSIATGTQRRHEKVYHETYKRILDGAIGDIVSARCYWNQGELWHKDRQTSWSPMEWMIRDWVNWCWLSGDHIVEQHVHNLDVINWFTSKDGTANHPVKAMAIGGRARRPTGDQYDHFAVDFEFENGMHCASYCRQINGCDNNVTETIIGTKGYTRTASGTGRVVVAGKTDRFEGNRLKQVNPYVQEHRDLIESIEKSQKLNEANNIATSTLTAIMGRIAAYTGQTITWDQALNMTKLRLGPKEYSFDIPMPTVEIPVPGRA